MERQPLDHRGSGPLAPPPGVVAPGAEPSLRPTAPVQHAPAPAAPVQHAPAPAAPAAQHAPAPAAPAAQHSPRPAAPAPALAWPRRHREWRPRALRPYPRPRRLLPLARRRAPRLMLGPFRLYRPPGVRAPAAAGAAHAGPPPTAGTAARPGPRRRTRGTARRARPRRQAKAGAAPGAPGPSAGPSVA